MKITCTAPNGAKFEASADIFVPQDGSNSSATQAANHNVKEREAMQEALETWCMAMDADPAKAEERT